MDSSRKLVLLPEPMCTFGHNQNMTDPRDGLFLFGPLNDARNPIRIRAGLVGTINGIKRYKRWLNLISHYIPSPKSDSVHQKAFPGFSPTFNCDWSAESICEIIIDENTIWNAIHLEDRHQAIFNTVSIFSSKIQQYLREEDSPIDVWFVIIPEYVHQLGRPKSRVPISDRVPVDTHINKRIGKKLLQQPSIFAEDNEIAQVYRYELNFHHQLKARLLNAHAVVQIIRETSLTPEDFVDASGRPLRKTQDSASIAWNLSTTAFFKAGGKPWKLANVREGVCYIGLVYKIDSTNPWDSNACCGAQMFLDSGEGLVFKGAVGPWYSEETREFHIPYEKAKELITMVVEGYKNQQGNFPNELFLHGKTLFNDDEWRGFCDAVPPETKLVGVRIKHGNDLKLYTPGMNPALRGTVYKLNDHRGYLWTKGFIPQLQTYPGREVPNPLDIDIHRGNGDLYQVMRDIMGLTKVNYNACIHSDGIPVTLRFADAVGEILTAAPVSTTLPPLPFKHYI